MALPQIKPKESKESNLALLSKIHVSKNWKLPPRLPHRASQQRKRAHQLHDEYESDQNDEELLKKKRQNRDAQRAYRERKNNKLQVLEDTIESLTKIIKNYETKLTRLHKELHEKDLENHALKLKLDTFLPPKQPAVPAQDPILQNLIENFKPMKAIPIKHTAAMKHHHHRPNELPNSAKCGFCSDNTACVCKELEPDSAKADDVATAVQKDMTPPHSQCKKGNPSQLCDNCTNIDKSCIDIRSIIH
ncbi:yap5p [Saccharomyces arboricola H-6]|uniref:Yap5p n=1 Tax=Saccharomyces arboricola (strain H-6 / AS 2.3317 / CBS 10644) TaxID=1160507 RepID=J8Q3Q9_SACAR|nr:yap5p [Saccharomyces arboricola H-6]